MTVACPCCRAVNETSTCRRCKADLALLFAVEERRAWWIAEAKRLVAGGRRGEALESLNLAAECRGGADVKRLIAALHVLNGDFPRAAATRL